MYYSLKPGSLGHDTARRIPNFNDNYEGKGPDYGALENTDSIQFGHSMNANGRD
jgi:hypothetical protein